MQLKKAAVPPPNVDDPNVEVQVYVPDLGGLTEEVREAVLGVLSPVPGPLPDPAPPVDLTDYDRIKDIVDSFTGPVVTIPEVQIVEKEVVVPRPTIEYVDRVVTPEVVEVDREVELIGPGARTVRTIIQVLLSLLVAIPTAVATASEAGVSVPYAATIVGVAGAAVVLISAVQNAIGK